MCFLQCFDTVGLVTGRTRAIPSPEVLYGNKQKKNRLKHVHVEYTWKMAVETEVCMCMYVCILWAGAQPTLDPYAEALKRKYVTE